jgi:HEAT repeat protein
VRIAAIGAIGEIGVVSETAVQMLVHFTGGADHELAIAALRALGSVDAPSVLDPLRRALSAAQPERRAAAAEALARHGGSTAVELLEWTAAGDTDHAVARAAIDGLSRIGDGATPYAGAAIGAIAAIAGDSARRAEAIAALAGVSNAAIPRVGAALASREAGVRCAVVEALGRLAHPAASEYVVTALSDGDASVRQAAVMVVSRLGTRGVARAITGLAATDPSEGVRLAAENALRRMGKGPDDVAAPSAS